MLNFAPAASIGSAVQPVGTGGSSPIRNETDFDAVLPLSVAIVATHVYFPSARSSMSKEAVSEEKVPGTATGAAPPSE